LAHFPQISDFVEKSSLMTSGPDGVAVRVGADVGVIVGGTCVSVGRGVGVWVGEGAATDVWATIVEASCWAEGPLLWQAARTTRSNAKGISFLVDILFSSIIDI
jgi:hypothetical protein